MNLSWEIAAMGLVLMFRSFGSTKQLDIVMRYLLNMAKHVAIMEKHWTTTTSPHPTPPPSVTFSIHYFLQSDWCSFSPSPKPVYSLWYSNHLVHMTVTPRTKLGNRSETNMTLLSHRPQMTSGAVYPWQQGVVSPLNVELRQSGCILIRGENCCYKWNGRLCICMQKQ